MIPNTIGAQRRWQLDCAGKRDDRGSSWWTLLITGVDDRLKLTFIEALEETAYWAGMRDALSALPPGRSDILVFLHGYNVSFEEAALRAAQISCDLKFPGLSAFFSWPSQGTLGPFAYDMPEIDFITSGGSVLRKRPAPLDSN